VLLDGADNIFRSFDVGSDRFVREVFAGRDLLQGSGVEHNIHALKSRCHRMKVADIAEKTMTLAGSPESPLKSRRTRTFPREPVPPVTNTRFPSKTLMLD
jgi:hypothetical protein